MKAKGNRYYCGREGWLTLRELVRRTEEDIRRLVLDRPFRTPRLTRLVRRGGHIV